MAITFRPWHICTGITESREISWLGQAWLSATQFSPAAFKVIYAGLPTPRLDSFWMAFPITPSFQNTMIPLQPGTEWPGFETLPGTQALPSHQLTLSLLAAPKALRHSWAPKGQRSHSCFSLLNIVPVDKSLCHRMVSIKWGHLWRLLRWCFTLRLKLMGDGKKKKAPSAAFPGWA